MIIVILFIVAVITAFVQSFSDIEYPVFTGAIGSDFELAGNWSTRIVPTESDSVFIFTNSPKKLIINKGLTVKNFIISKGWKGVMTLNEGLTVCGNLTLNSEMYANGNGVLTLSSLSGYASSSIATITSKSK